MVGPTDGPYLSFRYADSGDEVTVPNCHYNQPPSMRLLTVRHQIMLEREKINLLQRRMYISDEDRLLQHQAILARIAALEAQTQELRIAAGNEGMGTYSCGNPAPDNLRLPRTRVAFQLYESNQKSAIDQAFDRVFTSADAVAALREWEQLTADAQADLQMAYYFDTSHINSRASCALMSIDNIAKQVARAKLHDQSFGEFVDPSIHRAHRKPQ